MNTESVEQTAREQVRLILAERPFPIFARTGTIEEYMTIAWIRGATAAIIANNKLLEPLCETTIQP